MRKFNKKILWIGLIIVILIFASLVVVNIFKPKKFKYEDYIEFIDNMSTCDGPCNLKGKYDIISDDIETIVLKDSRVLTAKIKGTDLTFKVYPVKKCSSTLDGSFCFGKKYVLFSNYNVKAENYFFEEYNKKVGNNYCYTISDSCLYSVLEPIKTKQDLKDRIDYVNGFVDYLNSLDYKVLERSDMIDLQFEQKYQNGSNKTLYIHLTVENDKYVYYYLDDEYEPVDGKLETYIQNFMDANDIVLN